MGSGRVRSDNRSGQIHALRGDVGMRYRWTASSCASFAPTNQVPLVATRAASHTCDPAALEQEPLHLDARAHVDVTRALLHAEPQQALQQLPRCAVAHDRRGLARAARVVAAKVILRRKQLQLQHASLCWLGTLLGRQIRQADHEGLNTSAFSLTITPVLPLSCISRHSSHGAVINYKPAGDRYVQDLRCHILLRESYQSKVLPPARLMSSAKSGNISVSACTPPARIACGCLQTIYIRFRAPGTASI